MYHYSVMDGLPSKEVHSIFQDSKGYIWICTDGGIARYNANNFRIFSSAEGLPDNTVFEIMEDKTGRLWFRTYSGGVGYIFNDTVHTIPANKKILEWQSNGLLQSFAMDEKGNLWLGRTGQDGCFFIKVAPPFGENNTEKIRGQTGNSGIDVRHFGSRLVFAEGRINTLLDRTPYIVVIRDKDNNIVFKDSIASGKTEGFSRFFRNGNEIIFGSGRFVRRYDIAKRKKYFFEAPGTILTFLKDKQNLMVGFRPNGLMEFGNTFDSVKTAYLNGLSISAITRDNNNGYWFGTLENGIYYCPDKNHFRIKIYNNKDEDVIISSLKMNDSVFLFGSLNGELISLINTKNEGIRFKRIGILNKKSSVQYLYRLNGYRVLVITNEAMGYIYDLLTNTFNAPSRISYKDFGFNGSNYYAIALKDLTQFDSAFNRIKTMEFNDRLTSFAYSDKENKIYIGGLKGLYEIKELNEKFSGKPLLNLRVEALAFKNEKLFISTKNAGIIIKSGENYDTITKDKGLGSNICRKLFVNGEDVWVLTSIGFSRITYKDIKHYKIKNYNFSDHIFPEGVNAIHFINNTIVYADKGDVYFYPISNNKFEKSPFTINSVFVNGKKRNMQTTEFGYNEADVQVNFAALFYQNNRMLEYRYRFNGDTIWKYTRNNELRFPKLASGTYSLILQVKNDSDEWINCENQLHFTIKKPVWQTPGFILSEVILGICFVLLLVRYRYKKILEKERDKNIINNRIHELEVKHLKSQMNPHFIFNSLNTLQRFILEEDTSNAHDYLTKFSGLLRKMLESSTSDTILLTEEIEIINHYIEVEKIRFRDAFDYKVLVHVKDPEKIKVPFMLIQPFVENAIWHGLMPKTGERLLTIVFSDLDPKRILCVVDDNGVGRNYKNKEVNPLKKKSLAIEFISHRLELLKKATGIECSVTFKDKKDDSGNSRGTTVAITIPKLN